MRLGVEETTEAAEEVAEVVVEETKASHMVVEEAPEPLEVAGLT